MRVERRVETVVAHPAFCYRCRMIRVSAMAVLVSGLRDGDYVVTRSVGGLLSRHDRNSVGSADSFLIGMLAESRRTRSFHKWELGGGLVAKHESEARRGTAKTTLLPWGVLASRSSACLPQSPGESIMRASILWGLGGSITQDGTGSRSVHVLPFGFLLRRTTGLRQSSFHVLGTGFVHNKTTNPSNSITRFRLLDIPLWASHNPRMRPKASPSNGETKNLN
jgi:hypothetical protein